MQKLKKLSLWFLGIVLGLVLLIILIANIYFYTNKKSILQSINAQLSKSIAGDVAIADVNLSFFKNFPLLTLRLDNVCVKDSLFKSHHLPLLSARQLFVRLSWSSLFTKKIVVDKIRLEHASINVFTQANGYTNSYLLNKKNSQPVDTSATAKQPFNLHEIELNDVTINLQDAVKQKQYGFAVKHVTIGFNRLDSIMTAHIDANVLIKGLGFNLSNGSFAVNHVFEGKFDVQFNEKNPELSFKNIPVLLSKQPFVFTGKFTFAKEPTFNLQIQSKQIEYNFARSLVTPKIAKAVLTVSVEKPFDIEGSIGGSLNSGDPLVNIKWVVKNNIVHNAFIDFTNCSFNGTYTNEVVKNLPKKDPNSKVVATNFMGTWEGFVFTAPNIEINNLTTPNLVCNLTSQADVSTFNNLLETDAIVAQSGKASLYLNYKGPLENHNTTNTDITGKVSLRNASLLYTPKNVVLANCNGDIVFNENDLAVNNLNCDVEGNHIVMQGSATNVLKLVNNAADKINLQWSIYTPSLNLLPLKRLFTTNNPIKKITKKKSTSLKASQINNVLTNSNVTLQFKAAKLQYQKFEATNVKATVLLLENKWLFNNTGLQHAGGNMQANGSLTTVSTNNIRASVILAMQNMDVKKVMNSFNNFGLNGITSNNLSGKFYTNIVANAMLNNELEPYSKTIEAKVFFSLKNGTLINYEPLKAIQKIAFKKRDFTNIAFAELKDTVTVKNEMITINRMEIASSALRMYVTGLYDINGKATDLSFQIPLSNLKKQDSAYIPTNNGTHKDGGASIFIRARPNDNGELKFRYDLFKRFRKTAL
jgi:hypothetical protein